MKVLIVGSGFAGATIARELSNAGGYRITVIDQRDHIAGNAFDPIDPRSGIRYHKYGPHIFHTNSRKIVEYLSRFTEWMPYRHRVQAVLTGGRGVPMPINLDTINAFYGLNLQNQVDLAAFLTSIRDPIDNPANAEEHLLSLYGRELTEVFFGRYTRKMWGLELADMPVSVVSRLPVRYGRNDNYFDDKYQLMPAAGYQALFEKMLDHELVQVRLNMSFDKDMERDYDHVFNSMPIDDYFESTFGPLPYRSIRFEHRFGEEFPFAVPTVNFTDEEKYTRKTSWALYPGGCGNPGDHVTYETPCSYEDNNLERYYPIKTADGWPQRRYGQYQALARRKNKMTFIGRCGQYQYYDMDQAVANSLMISRRFINTLR
jgi:UDP-galactopyranose mutase